MHSICPSDPHVHTIVAPLPDDLQAVLEEDNLVNMWKQAVEVEP
jgi:hypothetical protein